MEKKYNYKKTVTYLIIQMVLLLAVMVGMALNMIAIRTNDGKMPVLSDKIEFRVDSVHSTYKNVNEVNNWLLTDIFFYQMTENRGVMYSLGDFLISFSIVGLLISWILMISKKYGVRIRNRKVYK